MTVCFTMLTNKCTKCCHLPLSHTTSYGTNLFKQKSAINTFSNSTQQQQQQRNVLVVLLDDTIVDVNVDVNSNISLDNMCAYKIVFHLFLLFKIKSSVGDVFHKLCDKLQLKENDIFGLAQNISISIYIFNK